MNALDGTRVKTARHSSRLIDELIATKGDRTDADLAADLGISAAYMSLLRAGLRRPSMRLVERILKKYPELSPYHLLDLQGDPPAKQAVA